jgi:pSer/pThr/pTyr-binding forkhead associated (FHA) protein
MTPTFPTLTTEDGTPFSIHRDGLHSIGRENTAIVLADASVLPHHASLLVARTRVSIKAEGGALVLVNGQPITGTVNLSAGDTITIGEFVLRLSFEAGQSTAQPPSAPFLPKEDVFKPIQELLEEEEAAVVPPSRPPQPIPEPEDLDEEDEKVTYGSSPLVPSSRPTTETEAEGDDVHFTAYYPREIEADSRVGGVYVYAYLESELAAIQKDVEKFKEELGDEIPRPRSASNTVRIQPDTPIIVSIECDDLEFVHTSIKKRWRGSWERFDFEFYPPQSPTVALAHISISVAGIEVARIPNCAIEVVAPIPAADPLPMIDNPIYQARLESQSTRLYQKIFISYSRKDTLVVEAYRKAQLALGNDVFMDTYSTRTGANWQAELARFIDEADVFQLFWSEASSTSQSVRDEWEYALKVRCPDDGCVAFIRPVIWKKPIAITPPPELGHLNFRYVDLED